MKIKLEDIPQIRGSSDVQKLKSMSDSEIEQSTITEGNESKPLSQVELSELKRVEK